VPRASEENWKELKAGLDWVAESFPLNARKPSLDYELQQGDFFSFSEFLRIGESQTDSRQL
jgi:hypothetical protein